MPLAAAGITMAQQMPNPYGPNINLATAKKVAVAAAEEAAKLKLNVLITIVDTGGNIVSVEGGAPILQDGKIIAAIGISRGSTAQDGEVARADAAVVK
jgi:uncharacterized protein GlcG (DUF336 family)